MGCPCQKLNRPQRAANSQGRQRVERVAELARSTDFMAPGVRGGSCSRGPESSRVAVDSRSENTSFQSENNSSSRPPFVAVMQSANLRQFNDRPQFRRLNQSGLRCIFLQRQVRARLVVIIEVRFERASQRRFVEHDEVVQTFPSDGSDQALHIGTLPWRSRGCPTDLPRRREQGFSPNCLRLKNLPSDNG